MTDLKQIPAGQIQDGQDRPDQQPAVRIPLIEAIEYCRSSDLPVIIGEVDLELQMVRLGQGRWKEMRLDLMCRQVSSVRPIDYCVEISPEEAAYLKENEGIDLDQLLSSRRLYGFAKMLDLRRFELMREYTLEDVLLILDDFEARICYLTRIWDALRRAMRAEVQAYRAAQQTDLNEPQTEAPPISRKKPQSRKKR
jgi:hypothetical protein